MKLVGSREAVRSPEFHKKRVRQKLWRASLFVIAAMVVLVSPVFALRDPLYQVQKLDVSGNNVTKTEDIEKVAEDAASGRYAWVVPKSNALLYPASAIERELLSAIPRLSSAKVTLASLNEAKIGVTEREPYSLYCAERCYFLDSSGYIFSEAPSFSDGVYMIYKSEPSLEDPIGHSFISADDFKKLDQFVGNLSRLSLTPLTVRKSGEEYTISLKEGPALRLEAGQDLNAVYANLKSFLSESGSKLHLSELQYLDLRFDNKIYYK